MRDKTYMQKVWGMLSLFYYRPYFDLKFNLNKQLEVIRLSWIQFLLRKLPLRRGRFSVNIQFILELSKAVAVMVILPNLRFAVILSDAYGLFLMSIFDWCSHFLNCSTEYMYRKSQNGKMKTEYPVMFDLAKLSQIAFGCNSTKSL